MRALRAAWRFARWLFRAAFRFMQEAEETGVPDAEPPAGSGFPRIPPRGASESRRNARGEPGPSANCSNLLGHAERAVLRRVAGAVAVPFENPPRLAI